MTQKKASGRGWLWGITLGITVFISFYLGLAHWAYQSDVNLMYDNYYAKDIVFEQQIRRVERTEALPVVPHLSYDQQTEALTVRFPETMHQTVSAGQLLLFRPANFHHDRSFPLELVGDTLQVLNLPDLDPGLWRIKLSWTADSLEYYLEHVLMAP